MRVVTNVVWLLLSLLALAVVGVDWWARTAFGSDAGTSKEASIPISTDQFRLVEKSGKFMLQFTAGGRKQQIAIPREWLIPAREEKQEEDNYVPSFSFGEEITSFPIGNGQIGLQLSSYDQTFEGTSHAAAGRDVFLIFDPKSRQLKQGGLKLGITKARVRSEGCLSAIAHTFYLADIDEDGLIDIGVITERLKCIPLYNKKKLVDTMAGPFYYQEPMRWYLFEEDRWNHKPDLDGLRVVGRRELPPLMRGFERWPWSKGEKRER